MAVKTNYNSVLRDLQSSFRDNYKYKILGKSDLFFQFTAKMIEGDQTRLSLFKSRRTAEQAKLQSIQADASLTDNQKLQKTAETKIGFLKDAYRTIKAASVNKDVKTTDLKNAVSHFLREMEQAVNDYITSRGGAASADTESEDIVDISEEGQAASGGSPLSAEDHKFFNDAKKIIDDMGRIASKLRIKVRSEGIFFDNTTYQASKRVETIKSLIASIQSGAAATPPTASGSGTGVDITV